MSDFKRKGDQVTIKEFGDISKRTKEYKNKNGVYPTYTTFNGVQITHDELVDALLRYVAYNSEHTTPATLIRIGEATSTPTPEPAPTPTPSPPTPQTETIYLTKNPNTYVPQVYMFQEVCQTRGYYQGYKVDGYFGDKTEEAVKAIQKDNNIQQTGGIGCLTWIAGVYAPCPFGQNTNAGEFSNYLQATSNCEVNNNEIQALGKQLGSGETIFNYVRDEIEYDFYYNTKYGALGTLHGKVGNCTDCAHLIVALARAAGIPARYVNCSGVQFNSGVYGHVWAELYVNGAWIKADASNNGNSFGNNPRDSQIVGSIARYIELPF